MNRVWCAIIYCCLTRRTEILRTHLISRADKEKFRFGTSASPLSMENICKGFLEAKDYGQLL